MNTASATSSFHRDSRSVVGLGGEYSVTDSVADPRRVTCSDEEAEAEAATMPERTRRKSFMVSVMARD